MSKSDEWMNNRPKLISLFEEHIYGKISNKKTDISFESLAENKNALNGEATCC